MSLNLIFANNGKGKQIPTIHNIRAYFTSAKSSFRFTMYI